MTFTFEEYFLKALCITLFLCKMRLYCLILLKISGLKGLNVVTYGIISDSFLSGVS